MNVMVIGGGGREHALCWAIGASPLCERLYCAPGNAGIAAEAECLAISVDDIDGLVAAARDRAVDLVIVGPEAPLVAGLVDQLAEAGIKAFGPTAAAAALEGSKAFMKDLCARHGIASADFRRFADAQEAKAYVRERGAPIVVKADGLAAGKGVVVAATVAEAEAAIDAILVDRAFGDAGAELVIEECLTGTEASVFALVDGHTVLPLGSAQDHKRAHEGDQGPNTGGMGAFSPSPVIDEAMQARVMREIVEPTVRAMAAEGRPYKGVLFAGLMIDGEGPKLLEFNVRFGDPECQAIIVRLMTDLLQTLLATVDGVLETVDLRWYDQESVCVVMAADGYPGDYAKGNSIRNLDAAEATDGVTVFHAGTRRGSDGRVRSDGGRVLGITATGDDLVAARKRAYAAIDRIAWDDGWCRRDIGATASG